jgi:serralysin
METVMATLKTKPYGSGGVDTAQLDINRLGYYSYAKTSSTTAKFYDDSSNYAQFTGTGFRIVYSGPYVQDITGGTITGMTVAVGGVAQFSFTGLNLSAAKIFDFYASGNAAGAWEYLFSASDTITGTSYADIIAGGGGNDTMDAGSGNDILNAGIGNDLLTGGSGADALIGGTGTDTASYAAATKGITASLAKSSANTNDAKGDTYSSIENLTGSRYADSLYGNSGANSLSGGDGSDRLVGGAGADKLIGGSGTDTASYAGATKGVTANLAKSSANTGDAKGDTYSSIESLTGSSYGDRLTGNTGVNRMDGGKGNDVLAGGSGADVFVFSAGYGKDVITDFSNNVDDIDLRSYDFSSSSSVLKKATQVGTDVHIKLTSTDIVVIEDFKLGDLDARDFLL